MKSNLIQENFNPIQKKIRIFQETMLWKIVRIESNREKEGWEIHHPDQVMKEKMMTGTLKIEAVTKLGKI
jgi:hypothetical protein